MIPGFESIVEERIKKAQQDGAFNNLPGAGRPLDLQADQHIPEDLRLPYKILKNADCLPEEIVLKKEIRRTEDLLNAMPDTADRYKAMRKLNFLIMKLNVTRSGAAAFDVPQKYLGAVTDRICSSKSK
jgi:DnaJ homologue, subfamily C, member 28, conserved domain